MSIEFTEWAIEIIGKADVAARRLNPDARVRLARAGSGVQALLTDGPDRGDTEVTVGDAVIFIQDGVVGLIDIEEPHDRIVLKPAGSTPNVREPH
jgi:hypothetical protein